MGRNKEDVIKVSRQFGKKVATLFDGVEVYLYGSHHKGTSRQDSDIDLAVVSPDFEFMDYIISLKVLNRLRLDVDLDIEPLSLFPSEIKFPQLGSIAYTISKDSELVYKSSY